MSFVILMALSLMTLIQIEVRAAKSNLQSLRARESARLALMLAIGQLQKNTADDQRVTARAEILGEGNYYPKTRFWTGVWNTTNPAATPIWLVSAAATDPGKPPIETMPLAGFGSVGADTTHHVHAPVLHVLDTSGKISDAIAWWISDEGVKASVGKRPLHLRAIPNFIAPTSISTLSSMLSTSHGIEEVFIDYNRFSSACAQKLEQVASLEQLLGQNDFSDRNQWNLSSESPFHAITPLSLGVLASVRPNRGLMQDLSLFPKLISAEFEDIIRSAAQTATANALSTTYIDAQRHFVDVQGLHELGALTDGQIAAPISPVLSNLMMAFTIRQNNADDPRLYLRMAFFTELWNPFTSTLKTSYRNGEPMELQLEITGLPTVEVVKYRPAPAVVDTVDSATVDIQDLLADSAHSDSALVIRLLHDHSELWLPGRTKNWTGISDADETAGASPYESITTDSKLWHHNSRKLGGIRGIDTQIDLQKGPGLIRHFSSESSHIRIKLLAYNPKTEAKRLLAEYGDIHYEPVNTLQPSTETGYQYDHSEMTFGYHIQLREPRHSHEDLEYYRGRWLHDNDPRNPSPTFNAEWHLTNDASIPQGSPYIPVIRGSTPLSTPTPEAINQSLSHINFPEHSRLLDRSSPHLYKLWQDAPLFELPRERPLSLASLQHLYFHNERPNKVGNSWGDRGSINTSAWFDRYYLSGLSQIDTPGAYDPTASLPNPTLVPYQFNFPVAAITRWQTANSDDLAQSRELAQRAFVIHRFNLNSTSIAAWKSVLGGQRIKEWNYLDYPEDSSDLSSLKVSQDSCERMFSRFSHSLSETYKAPQTPAFEGTEAVAPSAYYRRGARHFDASEIELLAEEIVKRIKRRGAPFQSMEAFLSEESPGSGSLLEQAIAASITANGRQRWDHQWETAGTRSEDSKIIDIDHFAPGFLTQADIMTAIGPMLAPRSDTFKIRARSQTYSKLGTPIESATIEAVLQRTPDTIVPTASINQPAPRIFKIISLRWLTDDQI
jgi:hypothetical protein